MKSLLPLLLITATLLRAQSSEISGRILDTSKAAVTGAVVTITRAQTGDHRGAVSSADGYYAFPLLLPGNYEVKVAKDGFQTLTRTGIRVETGATSTVDLELTVGTLTQSLTVDANAPLLEAQSAAIAAVVENQTIVDMPLIDRRSAQLVRLNGYVVQNGTGSQFAIAGGRGNNANFLIDGGTAQNLTLGVPTLSFDPPVESMQEFNVAISNYAAELGRTGGGVVQMTTKSGGNEFHGSTYEYFRNDAMDARNFFAGAKPTLRYNLFGASLGGPIKKNKTQFFYNYEGKRNTTANTRTLNVPTTAEMRGDFSADPYAVRDPLTASPFPGNLIPSSRLDPVGAKLAAFYPAPNVIGAQSGNANFLANNAVRTPVNTHVARIDHVFGDRDRIFGRLLAQVDRTVTASLFHTAGTDNYGRNQDNSYYNASGTWYHSFSSSLINEARYTYTRRKALNVSLSANTKLDSVIGLTGVNQAFFPNVVVSGFELLGTNSQQRLQTPIRSDQLMDSVTVVRGAHQIKFGVEYRYSKNLDRYSPTAGGQFTFNDAATGSGLASLLLGWVQKAARQETYPLNTRADTYAGFIQDDWRATPKLTLNLGLRYDVDQPRWETNNRQNSFDRGALNPVSGTPGVVLFSGRNGLAKYASDWDLNNFGPRLGFAWKASDSWVVRGGAAVLYTDEYDQATPIVANTGFSVNGAFVSPDNGITPAFILSNGMPGIASPTNADLTPGFGAVKVGAKPTNSVEFFEPKRSNGYLYQVSLDIQRQLRGHVLMEIGYLATLGHHLPAPDSRSIDQVPSNLLGPGNTQVLRPFPQYSDVRVIAADIGNSNYHGLNLRVEKRYSNGLQFQANYTFSKFVDDLTSRNELAGYPGRNAFANYYDRRADRGLSGNDIRHRFIWSSIYQLPFGGGRRLVGGWSLALIGELRTGSPLSVIELVNNTNSFSDGVRPNVVGSPTLSGGRPRGAEVSQWFNVKAFATPAPYTFGNAGRTVGEGPGAISLDASLLKDSKVAERARLQFRVESLNFINNPNFAAPDTRQGSPTFGRITSLIAGNQARIIQLGLHLKF